MTAAAAAAAPPPPPAAAPAPTPAPATCQVRVAVRVRPLTSKEASEGGKCVLETNPFDKTVSLTSRRKFTYDQIFHPGVSQSELYDDVSPPLLDAFLGGYNATIVAYGQTGSGKTYTCGSEAHHSHHANDDGEGLDESAGLIPRFMSDIFSTLIRRKEESERAALRSPKNAGSEEDEDALVDFKLTASFLEVYGEDIHDLLDEDRSSSLPIREDSNGEVVVRGLREATVSSADEAVRVLNTGTMNRTTAATLMNCTSSRSHAVFAVNLTQTTRSAGGVDVTASSRFNFVDLAGSERMKRTGAEGQRAREGIKINEGLLALGNVINALADEERLARGEKVHVPYRQSKLTRLLQDALGGNSRTLFVACVSPSDTNASETLSTLQYAHRARNIRNAPTRNVDAAAAELRRLRTLAGVLRCELVRQKFAADAADAGGDGGDVGVVSEEMMERDDVAAYLLRIDEKVSELSGGAPALNVSFPTMRAAAPPNPATAAARQSTQMTATLLSVPADSTGRNSMQSVPARSAPRSLPDSTRRDEEDDALILDVNPEEDMQIIDQLLELQQQDQRFLQGQRDDQDRLNDVEGEIEAQEGRLLQLREHLKVYHSMKDKYERLMEEVHSLESEKQALAEELERAQRDPAKGGCSQAIRAKLQKVEEGLARARSETRKHQQICRQAEQEAAKCKVLERKIQDLKHAKVNLVKKQREDAARHKEFTNQKAREIHALKRKEKTADKKISKMVMEVQKYKANLDRSRSHCDKLSDKLKQTESHLMRLLAKRRNDLNRGNNKSARQSRAYGSVDPQRTIMEGVETFAPVNEEVRSIKFLLEKTISDRVSLLQNREAFEVKVIEHGKLMQMLAKEARCILETKKEYRAVGSDGADEVIARIHEHEDAVQDLQLQIELLENDMEQLRAKFPRIEDEELDEADEDGPAFKMIGRVEAPVLRTLLWHLLETYSATELQRRTVKEMLNRKESTLKSFENEVSVQSEKIDALTKTLERHRNGQETDPFDMIQDLENEIKSKNDRLDSLSTELDATKSALLSSQAGRAEAEERMALFHAQQKLSEPTEGTDKMLAQLQGLLATIGVTMDDRESIRLRLENCVEDACARMLNEATTSRDEKTEQVKLHSDRLDGMYAALGLEQQISDAYASSASRLSLNGQLDSLGRQLREIEPQYQSALERFNRLAGDAESLASDLCTTNGGLSANLQKLIRDRREGPKNKRLSQIPAHHRESMEASREARAKLYKDVEQMISGLQTIDEDSEQDVDGHDSIQQKSSHHAGSEEPALDPGSLSTAFLDSCEQDIKKLRLEKSRRLLSNVDVCEKIRGVVKQMHIGSGELASIVLHGLKKQQRGTPQWWDDSLARVAYEALFKKSSVPVTSAFTDHLNLILETIQGVAKGRQLLSDTLATVIKEGHVALIATAEGVGMDVEDVAQTLNDLFHLPPLSKEHIKACIEEMEMLVTAAESVTQSEVETLTVLWEGLNHTSGARGRFWGALDRATTEVEMSTATPFDNILGSCPLEMEEWVLKSLKDATRVQRTLSVRLFKLTRIHSEVEKLKRRQDSRNAILSLNSELELLRAKFSDFEAKAGDKERLLNKKANSSSLLDEERFRKQMQGMFATKLESLRRLLVDWEANEGKIEDDDDILSEVVKSMLDNSHRIDAWMNEKTKLMHLRTTHAKSRYRPTTRPERDGSSTGTLPLPGAARSSSQAKPTTQQSSASLSKRSTSAPTAQVARPTSQRTNRPARSTIGHKPRSNQSPPRSKNTQEAFSVQQKRKALSSSTHNAAQSSSVNAAKKVPPPIEAADDAGQSLNPFGNLLSDTPTEKENGASIR